MMLSIDNKSGESLSVYVMEDNNNGGLPFFVAKYDVYSSRPKMHAHDFIQINYVYSGKATHIVNDKSLEIIKGDIFVIPPKVAHSIVKIQGESAVIFEFEFTPDFINQNFHDMKDAEVFLDFAYIKPFLVSQDLVKPRFNLCGNVRTEVEHILNEVYTEYTNRHMGFDLLVKAQLLRLLVIVGREFSEYLDNSKTNQTYKLQRESIMNAINYIESNYYEKLTSDAVAKKFMLSPSYFNHLFKYFTSRTFTEYLISVRISKALELLITTDRKILDICYDVGFNNVNHFNRIFKREMSMSPIEYRKSRQ